MAAIDAYPGLRREHPHASSLERRITVVAVVLPFVGFLGALWLLWGGFVTGRDLRSSPSCTC